MMPRGHTVMDTFKDEVATALQNSFIAGLKTEFTGLNFPPNAATDCDNVIFTMIGDVARREGFDYENNYVLNTIDRTEKAVATYRWLNVGGDGETQVVVQQVGDTLYFYESSAATTASPLSTQILPSTITISSFLANGSVNDPSTVECQFSDGNGYLFVYHPYCDPFYCIFSAGEVISYPITVQIRDFLGYPEASVPVSLRPSILTNEHNYNLQNQGWTNAPLWTATSTTSGYAVASAVNFVNATLGNFSFTVASGISGIVNGFPVNLSVGFAYLDGNFNTSTGSFDAQGTVVSYSGTTLIIDTSYSGFYSGPIIRAVESNTVSISASNLDNLISTWNSDIGNYPSNADVWWLFKDDTGVFNPSVTMPNITLPTSPAASGHFILNAFNQQQSNISGISSLTPITTIARPKTGAWFSGRVWYAGVDGAQPSTGDQNYYTWTESIYFSQIVTSSEDFGMCYQTNDPTDENLFNLLPSDGGVINIQGAGSIYKLFPIQNGMLVFAANGIWFITGSQGIGFTANDYTLTKISSVQSISPTSYVDVQGLPVFWNEEGIYSVTPSQSGLNVTPITLGTILSFYNNIPLDSKKYVKGAYNPITYVLQWIYRSTQETDTTSRYEYDSVLCLNVRTQAFYKYSLEGTPSINGINYIASPGGSDAPSPTFKYLTSVPLGAGYQFTFSEEGDTDYMDWVSYDNVGINFSSFFVTGYSLDGQAQRKFQTWVHLHVFPRFSGAYSIQGIWDFATSGNSGKYSTVQVININKPYFGMVFRRHRIRGQGYCLQLKVSSVNNQPFDIMGWSTWATQNESV